MENGLQYKKVFSFNRLVSTWQIHGKPLRQPVHLNGRKGPGGEGVRWGGDQFIATDPCWIRSAWIAHQNTNEKFSNLTGLPRQMENREFGCSFLQTGKTQGICKQKIYNMNLRREFARKENLKF